MKVLRIAGCLVLAWFATNVSAASFTMTTDAILESITDITNATSDVTHSSFKDDKIVLAAKDDATSFVASTGEIRGAQLQSALVHIRQKAPQLNATDLQLAQAIIAL